MKAEQTRVLVVDDFAPWRKSICSLLQARASLQVVGEAADGLEAIKKAGEVKPDIILLDIGLPRLNGIEAAKQLHRSAPSAHILFVTGISDADIIRAALSNGAQGCVLKADAGTDLLFAIETACAGKRYVSRGLAARIDANSN